MISVVNENDLEEARKQLASKLTAEKTRWGWCKLMVIGEGRAGKTQTIRSLLGDKFPFEPESASTVAGDIKLAKIHADKRFRLLEESERKERTDFLLWEATEKLQKSEESRGTKWLLRKLPNESNFSQGNSARSGARERAIAILKNISLYKARNKLRRESNKRIKEKKSRNNVDVQKQEATEQGKGNLSEKEIELRQNLETPKRLYFTMWDFAGQDVYKAVHHLFLTTGGVYLLVFDMSKLMSKDSNCSYKSRSDLLFWIKSTRMYSPKARICFVGTHRDKCKVDDLDKVDDILSELLKGLIPEEDRVFWENDDDNALGYFPVDNGNHERTESVFADLRKTLVSLALELESVNQQVSMKWVLFMSSLWDRQLESHLDYMPLEELKQEQQEFDIKDAEAQEMLDFCHHMGMVLHWNTIESLKDTVVLNPQWIIDAAALIMHERQYHEEHLKKQKNLLKRYRESYDLMHSKAVISEVLLKKVLWADNRFKNKTDFLLGLFETALLLCEHTTMIESNNEWKALEGYLVPSLLRNIHSKDTKMLSDAIDSRWEENIGPFIQDKVGQEIKAKLKFSWLPAGLFERLACVCMRKVITDRHNPAKALMAPETVLYYISVTSVGQVPVRFKYFEHENTIAISTVSGNNVSSLDIVKDIQQTVMQILKYEMQLRIVCVTLLVGEQEIEFDLIALEKLCETVVNIVDAAGISRRLECLGLWKNEVLKLESGFVNTTRLSFKRKDAIGNLSLEEFGDKKGEWKIDWEKTSSECNEKIECLAGEYTSLKSTESKQPRIIETLKTLIDGPMALLANMWKDALKHSAGTKKPLEEYKNVIVSFLKDIRLQPLMAIENWVNNVYEKVQDVAGKDHRYGIFLSHQGIKMDAHGDKISLMKSKMKTLKVLYEKTIKFKDEKHVPIFLDKDMIAGDHQHVAMLLAVCKSDKVMVFLDKDYFSRKWCLMEYFLAKSRFGVIMPFLVDMEIDKTLFPIPLPNGVTCDYMNERSGPDDEKYLTELQRYFGDKDSYDYTDKY